MGLKNTIFSLFVLLSFISLAQIDTSYRHSRNKAALYSAIFPGTGSFYNEYGHRKVQGRKHISWWRAPIYWGGLGVTGYYSVHHYKQAKQYKKEWLFRQDKPEGAYFYESLKDSSNAILIKRFDQSAKYRDYSIAGFILVYGINLLDAYTDAHFVTFDVSDNLSLNLQPKYFKTNDFGCSLVLNFK